MAFCLFLCFARQLPFSLPNPNLGRGLNPGAGMCCMAQDSPGTPPSEPPCHRPRITKAWSLTQHRCRLSLGVLTHSDTVPSRNLPSRSRCPPRTFWSCLGGARRKSCSSAFCSFPRDSWHPDNKFSFSLT